MEYKDYCGTITVDLIDSNNHILKGVKAKNRCTGTFTVRIDPELHFKIYLLSEKEDRSLNKTVERLLRKAIETMENE